MMMMITHELRTLKFHTRHLLSTPPWRTIPSRCFPFSSTTMTADRPHPPAADVKQSLSNNKKWVESLAESHPGLLEHNAKGQWPKILWLGCSDSRVPETTILGARPGDIFTHRNIANRVRADDLSVSAVIAYAVTYVKVDHVVLSGHTSCGGVKAAQGDDDLGQRLNDWLHPLRELRRSLESSHGWADLDQDERTKRLLEANVQTGIRVLRDNADVKKGIQDRGLQLHGFVYNVSTGLVEELDIGDGTDHSPHDELKK